MQFIDSCDFGFIIVSYDLNICQINNEYATSRYKNKFNI